MAEEVKKNTWKKVLTGLTLAFLVLIVYFSRSEIGETVGNLGRVNVLILLLILFWQLVKNHAFAMLYKGCFEILNADVSYRSMSKAALELNFVNNVFPSGGVSGFSYFALRMKQDGVSTGKSTLVHVLRWVTVFASFQFLLFLGVFILAAAGKASNLTILFASTLTTLLLVITILAVYIIGSRRRINSFFTWITQVLNRLIHFVRPKHPETINIASAQSVFFDLHDNYLVIRKNYKKLKAPLFYAQMANVAELATIYCIYLAFDSYVNIGAIIIAYVVANFAGLISVLPGGVGVYEGLMTAVLATAGVAPSVSIPATIMYRVLTSAIQLPPGYYYYHKAINRSDKPLL